jgi:hypothetical protein
MSTINSINSNIPIQVALGGTGDLTLTSGGLLYGNGTGAIQALAQATNGQIPIGDTGTNPVLATLTGGTGISISNGAGSITINGSGLGMTWTVVTGTSQAMAVNNGYFSNNAGTVTFTLPSTAAVGSVLSVSGLGAGGWTIVENTGQNINFGSIATTTTSGSLSSSNKGDCVTMVCSVANTTFNVISSIGNITYV